LKTLLNEEQLNLMQTKQYYNEVQHLIKARLHRSPLVCLQCTLLVCSKCSWQASEAGETLSDKVKLQ